MKFDKFDVNINTIFFNKKVMGTSQSCEDIEAVPRSDMLDELFDHIKIINENFVSNTSIRSATKWKESVKSTKYNFIRFFWNCGFYGGTCPLKFTLTVPLNDVSKFYNSPEFVKCQIKLSGRQHEHYRHVLVSGSSDLNSKSVNSYNARSVSMYDVDNNNVNYLNEIRDFNKQNVYKQRSKDRKTLQKSPLISESLHILESESMMKYNSTLLNFGVLPKWMRGTVHDSMVGRQLGNSIYSVKSKFVCELLF